MKLNKVELKKISYEFNSKSNRLIHVNYQDFTTVLSMYIDFIEKTPIIFEYINDCGKSDIDMEAEFKEIKSCPGRLIFSLGTSEQEEVRNVYAILKHCVDVRESGNSYLFYGYSSDGSNKYQDHIKEFNERVTLVLINHIETFLTKLGIEMGLDEHITYNVNIENGQFNVANDNSTINAPINYGVDNLTLENLINKIKNNSNGISDEDIASIRENLDVIKIELSEGKPRKSLLNTALKGLNTVKWTVEFAAAVAELAQFVGPFL